MSLKAEIETWAAALKAYDDQDLEKSLELFGAIADSSKILTNIGLIYATMGEHEAAVENFNSATSLDQYLAVAYFQCGVSNFLLGRYELAYKDFEEALLYLRGNQAINYEQLGLKFRLYSAEVLFNKGLCQVYIGNVQEGLADMQEAKAEKVTEEHSVIDDAIADQGEGYTVFSIPVGVLYRPPDSKLKNVKTRDYMGTARLVASATEGDAYTAFTGVTLRARGFTPTGAPIEPEARGLQPVARAATTAGGGGGGARGGGGGGGLSPGGASVQRANTTINVVSPAGRGEGRGEGGGGGGGGAALTKSASLSGRGGGLSAGGPAGGRAPSLRGRGGGAAGGAGAGRGAGGGGGGGDRDRDRDDAPPPPAEKPSAKGSRVTEIYDDYLDAYGAAEEPPAVPSVAAWAKNASAASGGGGGGGGGGPGAGVGRSGSVARPPPSAYGGSSVSGRRSVRRAGRGGSRSSSRAMSMYEEEEEGYMSGDYDDAPFELVKIRVKLHYSEDVRGMAITPDMPFEEFVDKVCAKFGKAYGSLGFKFRDEDGGKVSLKDDTDYELAIETARESAKGKPEGKLEVWCTEQ